MLNEDDGRCYHGHELEEFWAKWEQDAGWWMNQAKIFAEELETLNTNRLEQLQEHGMEEEFGKWGCDTVEVMAETIVTLRQRLMTMEKALPVKEGLGC